MDILGQGISIIEGNNYLIENNEVKRIGLHAGYGIDGNNGGMGIIITNNEIRPEGYSFISHQNIIRKNRIDSVGNYAIRMDGSNSICEYNIVSNGLLTFNDGALIYCWGMDSTFTNHNIIRNNIVSRSHGNLSGSPKKQLINVGIYIDNNVNNVVVENNTISKTQIGILLNSLSYNNKATNNILFDNTYGISLSEYHPGHPIFGTEIKNNTIVGINYNQRTFFLKSYVHKSMNPGIIDDNISYNPKVEFLINYLTTYESFRRKEEMSFYEWQKRGFDINGKHIEANTNLEHKKQPEHLINFGISPKVVDLPKYNYSDFSGKKIESIKIPPYSSVVVLRSYHP
jgi:parallel beta-helix repeat protein